MKINFVPVGPLIKVSIEGRKDKYINSSQFKGLVFYENSNEVGYFISGETIKLPSITNFQILGVDIIDQADYEQKVIENFPKATAQGGNGSSATTDASQLTGTLPIARVGNGSITESKLAPAVVTKLNAVAGTEAPTITQGTVATLTPYYGPFPSNSSEITYKGTTPVFTNGATTANTVTGATQSMRFDFMLDGISCEIREKGTGAFYRLLVNDIPVSDFATSSPNDNADYYKKIQFSTSGRRKITMEVVGDYSLVSILTGSHDMIYRTIAKKQPNAIFIGDSYTEPKYYSTSKNSYAYYTGKALNWNTYQSGVSGTGYLVAPTFRSRVINDVINQSPDIVVIAGSLNDSSYTAQEIQTEAETLFQQILTALPNVKIIAIGPWEWTGNYDVAPNSSEAIPAACTTKEIIYVSTNGWISGYPFTPNSTGNANKYIVYLDIHPTIPDGDEYIGLRIASEIMRLAPQLHGDVFNPTTAVIVQSTTPVAPTIIADDTNNTLDATHALGDSEILVSVNNGSYTQFDGNPIAVGDAARAIGYWKFKTKSASGRNESPVASSPAFTTQSAVQLATPISFPVKTANVYEDDLGASQPNYRHVVLLNDDNAGYAVGDTPITGDGFLQFDYVARTDWSYTVWLQNNNTLVAPPTFANGDTDYSGRFEFAALGGGNFRFNHVDVSDNSIYDIAPITFRIRRQGSVVTFDKASLHGSDWSTLYQFDEASTGTLYPKIFIARAPYGTLVNNPKVFNG